MKSLFFGATMAFALLPGVSLAKKVTSTTCGMGFNCLIATPVPDGETNNRIIAALESYNSTHPTNPAVPGDIVTICNASTCADYEIYTDGTFIGSNRRPQVGGGGSGSGGPGSSGGGSGGGGGGVPNPGGGSCAPKCGTVIVGPPSKGD